MKKIERESADVVMIDGERYRKCPYMHACVEKQLVPQGEIVEVYVVMPRYYKDGKKSLDLRISWMQTRVNPGDKIRIIKEGRP